MSTYFNNENYKNIYPFQSAEHNKEYPCQNLTQDVNHIAVLAKKVLDSGKLISLDTNDLNDLRALLFQIEKEGLTAGLTTQITTIRQLCAKIIESHPGDAKGNLAQTLLHDSLIDIFSNHLSPQFKFVAKSWEQAYSQILIPTVNKQQLNLKMIFGPDLTATNVIDKLIAQPFSQTLEYADFSGYSDFNNECLDKLTKKFPNLKHLLIPKSKIEADALKHLSNTVQLQSLDI